MKTSRKILEFLLEAIANKTGQATSKEEAIKKGLDRFLWLDYASCYGGYRLVNVMVFGGGHSDAMGRCSSATRLKASVMETYLRGILTGLESNQSK